MRAVILLISLKFVMASVRVVLITNGDMSLSNNIARSSNSRMSDSLSGDADSISAHATKGVTLS